jgi:hypothetical protein
MRIVVVIATAALSAAVHAAEPRAEIQVLLCEPADSLAT